ncbi:MAG TPA: ABC transporter substrate-binding protein [Candidatus Saccharimonadales bacterium]|nr:ABC transporter substrate-binding protein [Candidatus Saccharimonadales bacterium]
MDDKQTEGERVNVSIGGTRSAAPVAPSAEPEAPATPETFPVPGSEEAPVAPVPAGESETTPAPTPTPEPEPAPAPPAPGSVVTSGDGTIGGPPLQAVTSNDGHGGKRWLKTLITIIIIALLAVGGWFAYKQFLQKKPAAPATVQNKNIPLLKVGILDADYGNLYPDMSASEYGYLINSQMFEGLVRYENKSKLIPDLASNWSNPDDNTWVFTIKDGIKFHDGHTLAPADVKYSLDTVMASNSDLAQTFAGTIASVDVGGNNQVKITTKQPDPTLLNKLAFLYIIDANLPKGDNPSLAGTGPYQIKSGTTPTSTNVQMVAFNGYHGGQPSTKALDFGSKDTATALVKAFQAHQFNIVGPIPPAQAKKVAGSTEFVTTEPDVDFIGFNTVKTGPLQNKLVRQAIRYAVNPQNIGQARGNQTTPVGQLIPEAIPGYNPAIKPYKQNVEKAKQLLAQAGYPNGLTLTLTTSDPAAQTDAIVNDLKQAGITVKVDQHNDFDEFIDFFNSGKAEMYTVDYTSDTLDGLDIYTTTLPAANYNNPKLTDLLNQANTTVDPAKRLKLLQQAATIVDQDVAVVPLTTEDNVWLMDKPYAIQQDMPSSFISVYFYKVQLK